MPLSFSAIELALIAWLEPTFGPGKVILDKGNGPQPLMPYALLAVSGPRRVGAPFGSVIRSYDAGQAPGQEVEERVVTEEELTVSVQAYAVPRSGDACAKALLVQARRRLSLSNVLAAMRAAGLALVDVGDTQDLSALLGPSFQGRAALDLRFLAGDEVSERTGYVETIGLTKTLS